MYLNQSQRRVLFGMLGGLVLAGVAFASTVLLNSVGMRIFADGARWHIAAVSALAPTCMLVICIMRLAKHRFFTPQDLDGSGMSKSSEAATLLQALLQNTLEQLAIALPVYFIWSIFAPRALLGLAVTSSVLFAVGRVLFFLGYRRGAAGRAFGFALTFYPTVALLLLGIFSVVRPE
ncbi:MAPEG family protein [Sphingomonas sp. NCPPB 2930]